MEEVVKSSYLNPKQVLRVFYATCSAVAHMHSLQPPIVHRDLKVRRGGI
jgi:cyclin G-associated kinase